MIRAEKSTSYENSSPDAGGYDSAESSNNASFSSDDTTIADNDTEIGDADQTVDVETIESAERTQSADAIVSGAATSALTGEGVSGALTRSFCFDKTECMKRTLKNIFL